MDTVVREKIHFLARERIMKKTILISAILMFSASGHATCPTGDLSGDCFVGLADLAVIANQWMMGGIRDIVFVDIPSGTFQMGDSFNEGQGGELPVHAVTLSSFKMSKYEVTNAQYAEYLNAADAQALLKVSDGIVYAASDDANSLPFFNTHSYDPEGQIDYDGSSFSVRLKSDRDMSNDPVVQVSWYGAKAFCDYYGYRLPTEAEWEYAARGGLSGKRFPWDDTINHNYANYRAYGSGYTYDTSPYTNPAFHPTWNDGIHPYTSPVGRFFANGYGLYDMAGNAREWCFDWYGNYPSSPQTNPTGSISGEVRTVRGASWYGFANVARVASRDYWDPISPHDAVGFRCCALGFVAELQHQAQFHHIGVALDMFNANLYGTYPPSNDNSIPPVNPVDDTPYGGAQKLAEALVGWDMLGFHPDSAFLSDGSDGAGNLVYDPTGDNGHQNIDERDGPFIELHKSEAFRIGDIYVNTGSFNPHNFVLCDTYKKVRHSGKKTGMPILYYRARTKHYDQDWDNVDGIEDDIYYYPDNENLLNLGAPDDGALIHPIADGVGNDYEDFENMILNDAFTTINRPYRANSYILISAGRDGIYGTDDDKTNFDKN